MLVTPDNYLSCIEEIRNCTHFALDTETTGLNPYRNDRMFSVAIATDEKNYYFDYNEYFSPVLCYEKHSPANIVNGFEGIVFMHNAKFDMAMMEKEGTCWENTKVHCTYAIGRIEDSSVINLSLANLGKKVGTYKSDKVKEYILEHKLWEWYHRPGKKAREKNMYFYKVPLSVIGPYAEKDAEVTLDVAKYQLRSLQRQNRASGDNIPSLYPLLKNERRLTKVFYRMERRGICIDIPYTKECIAHEQQNYEWSAHQFQQMTGLEFKDSGKLFKEIFDHYGLEYGRTKTGRASFDEDSLSKVDSPLAKLILEYRDAYKRAGTYESLLSYAVDGVLHANARQAGAVTGRVSYTDPPMQCMEKSDGSTNKYLIRRCFKPRPGYTLFMIDYDQMEYRMMLNYAGQMDLIEKIHNGLDVHTATAEMMNTKRKYAKCISEGSLVLTDEGEVPIEHIKLHHRIWDGVRFCEHDGIICKGEQEVIEWDGVIGTPWHIVYTQEGKKYELQFCKEYRIPLMVTASEGKPVRYSKRNKRTLLGRWVSESTDEVQLVYSKENYVHIESLEREDNHMQVPEQQKVSHKSRSGIIQKIHSLLPKMQQPQVKVFSKLWGKRNSPRSFLARIHRFFYEELLSRGNTKRADRQGKQQPKLHHCKYENNLSATELEEQKKQCSHRVQRGSTLCNGAYGKAQEGVPLFCSFTRGSDKKCKERKNLAGDTSNKTKVYDIQNVGPNFRFTVNGRLVTNCINFMLLYGGGAAKLGEALRLHVDKATALKAKYFSVLPKVQELIRTCMGAAKARGYIFNWFGRRCRIDSDHCYKGPNYLIQGGCADWMKLAMVKIDALLQGTQSHMLLSVHDEIVAEIKDGEEYLVPEIKKIMEKPVEHILHEKLPYTVGVEYSKKSWQDKEAWSEQNR